MHRIRLGNTVLEGLNNSYLFPGEPTTLVDTGVATPEVRAELAAGVGDAGLELADIDQVLLTHYHPDHAGLAAAVQEAGGASVYVHEADAPMVSRDEDALDAFEKRQRECYEKWDIPDDKRAELLAHHEGVERLYGPPVTVTPFTDGARFEVGPYTLEAIHTPGHTEGKCCFVDRKETVVFSGDTLLPHYTPNVGGADVRMDDSLQKYLTSLQRLIDGNFDRALPGHREFIDDPTARARAIVHHHEQRARKIVAFLEEAGPATDWAVSAHLFGELENIHILHGPGEAHAHLEHMYNAGELERTEEGYAVTDETAERLHEDDGDHWPLGTTD